MNDERLIKSLRRGVTFVNIVVMIITCIFQLIAFWELRHTILCSIILFLTTITLVLDGILSDFNEISKHSFWYIVFFFNLILNLF